MEKPLSITLTVLFTITLLFSGYQLLRYFSAEQETEEQFKSLTMQIEQPAPTHIPAQKLDKPVETHVLDWTVNDQYGLLFAQNQDMIGWITIDGTGVDYPVMQTPGRPDFYLKRGFDKQHSDSGVPYASESCEIDPQSDNIVIHGHHMKSGKVFGSLEKYKNENFFIEHPIIRFDTRAGFGTYEIIAVFKVNPADFQYHLFCDAADEEEFDGYIQRCKELSFYDTGSTAHYGDKLISLSTCEYSQKDNRLVVVAKKIIH